MKYIIIGGVAGGATAAARIRRNTEKTEIILFEKGEYISYANCGLPFMRFLILFLFILSTSLIQAQEVLLESKIKKSIENAA